MANLQGALSVLFACIALVGCNESTTVSGTVTYNGTPVESGAIMFSSVDRTGRDFGARIENGSFSVEEAFPGVVKAVVTGVKKIDFMPTSSEEAYAAGGNKKMKMGSGKSADYIPLEAEGNGQEIEVTPGEQTIDLVITGPPIE